MALKKRIELDNGVITDYHRIVSINKITNQGVLIEVASYTSEEKRKEEVGALKENKPINIFIDTTFVTKPYDEGICIGELYDYLKTVGKFEGAVNI